MLNLRFFSFLVLMVLFSLSAMAERRTVPPPWVPAESDTQQVDVERPVDEVVPVHWVETPVQVDGQFQEWQGLDGPVTRIAVFGSFHDPEDAEGRFVLKTDGSSLFVYAKVSDDQVNENELPGGMAWRNDSVEVFFGTDLSNHTRFRITDNHIRIVPKNSTDPFDFELSVNDVSQTSKTEAAVVFTEDGYELEAAIPLAMMNIDSLSVGQNIRCEFQVNDADQTERDRLVHWMSEHDDPWNDASVWGNGKVQE